MALKAILDPKGQKVMIDESHHENLIKLFKYKAVPEVPQASTASEGARTEEANSETGKAAKANGKKPK